MANQFAYHVNTFDPNLGTAASYSPPEYCEANTGLNDCPNNGPYGNVILLPNSGNMGHHENGLLSVAEAAQTIESGILDQYNILPNDHRIITYVRTDSTEQVYEAEQHHLLEHNDVLKGYQTNQHDDNGDSFVHHQNITDETGATQIIFRRSPHGQMYQYTIQNFILNDGVQQSNTIESNGLSVNSNQNGGIVVSEQHSLTGGIQQTFTSYDSANLVHQNHEMIVVPNDDRIGLYFNNSIPYEEHHNHNQTNLLIEPNSRQDYIPIDSSNEQTTDRSKAVCDKTDGLLNVVMPTIEDKDQLLEMTLSPLLAAVNDITNKSRNWSEVASMNESKSTKESELQYYDMSSSTTIHEGTINHPSVASNSNYKVINIRSSLSDEYVDINDVKTIQPPIGNNLDDEYDDEYDDENEANCNGCEVPDVRRSNRTKKLETFLMVADKHVPCRAWASLPTSYLSITKLLNSPNEYTVYSKKDIPLQTKFGPFEGDLRDTNESDLDKLKCELPIYPILLIGDKCLDVSNKNTSNWMRFVRFAETYAQQNLLLIETDEKLYFKTSQFIWAKQELRVGYSREYAEKYQLPLLKSNVAIENNSNCWSCFECEKKFNSLEDLQKHLEHDHEFDVISKVSRRKRHIKRQRSSLRYSCPVCSKTFFKNINFRRHLKNHSGNTLLEKHLPDSDSNKLINKNSSTSAHNTNKAKPIKTGQVDAKNKENLFKCSLCSKSFLNDERLKRHVMVHGPSELKPYQCPHCTRRFLNGSAMAAHIKIHLYGKFYFQCQLCNERFKQSTDFMAHVKIHMIDNSYYLCKFCNKKFPEYILIRKHIRELHSTVKHPCTLCDKKFCNNDKLRLHMLTHSDKKDFLCAVCGKGFKRKDKLKEHVKRIHTELKVTKSDELGTIDGTEEEEKKNKNCKKTKKKKFLPKVSPNDYQRFIYKCHECRLGFKRRGMLVNHLAKRHPDIRIDSVPELNLPILKAQKFYYCQYCNKVYRSTGKRKYHILKYHPGSELPMSGRQKGGGDNNEYPTYSETVSTITTNPHFCDWCHKQYASKPKLVEHQRKKHADQLERLNSKVVKNSHYYQSNVEAHKMNRNGFTNKESSIDQYNPNGVNYDINSTTHYNGNTICEPSHSKTTDNTIPPSDYQTKFNDMDYINLKPVSVDQSTPQISDACLMQNGNKTTTYCYSENGG